MSERPARPDPLRVRESLRLSLEAAQLCSAADRALALLALRPLTASVDMTDMGLHRSLVAIFGALPATFLGSLALGANVRRSSHADQR